MDIFIPLGTGSTWQNNELRYCLRSIERHAIGYDRIFIVGENPSYLSHSSSLRLIPCPELSANKQARIVHKILWTFQNTDISDDIAFFNDDFVLNASIDVRSIPYFQRGELKELAERHLNSSYRAALRATHDALTAENKPTFHYDLHLPIIYNREKFLALDRYWQASRQSTHGLVIKSTYANNVLPEPGPRSRDCKIREFQGDAAIEKLLSDTASPARTRFCFSYSDRALASGLKSWLEKRFPEKSIFEK
jgi:hypothetical protein